VGTVTLPSGRIFDLHRSRWDGVLDREEYEYCRQHGIALGYDCAQLGWVAQTFSDELSELLQRSMPPGPAAQPVVVDSEQRVLELRGIAEAEAERILMEVRQGRMSLDAAQQRLELDAASSIEQAAEEFQFGMSDWDSGHWALESCVVNTVATVRGPLHQPPDVPESRALKFRPWSSDDAMVYTELLGNPRIWTYLPGPFPSEFTVDTALALIEAGSIGFHHDTVAIEVDGRPIGQCLLRFDRPFAGTLASEVAYWLGEEYWGQGWMSRALPAFTRRSFRLHSVDVIYAWILKENEASIRVAESAGYRRAPFALEARLAESLRRPGFVRYATHRADWALGADQES
jgi:[ribosomal protein S5]-alanine N-acetyltransferase